MSPRSNIQQTAGFELGSDGLTTKIPVSVPYEFIIYSEIGYQFSLLFSH